MVFFKIIERAFKMARKYKYKDKYRGTYQIRRSGCCMLSILLLPYYLIKSLIMKIR